MKWLLVFALLPVFATATFATALNITDIGLFAYYNTGQTLNLTTAMGGCWDIQQSNISKGYIECRVKLTITKMGGYEVYNDDAYYSLIHVRVRSDGWIMSWMRKGDFALRSPYIYWNDTYAACAGGAAPGGRYTKVDDTILGAAINNRTTALGLVYSKSNVNYYDYARNTSKGFIIFGNGDYQQCTGCCIWKNYYYTIPVNLVGESADLSLCKVVYQSIYLHKVYNTSSSLWADFYGSYGNGYFYPANLTARPEVNLGGGILNGFSNCVGQLGDYHSSASAIIVYYHEA